RSCTFTVEVTLLTLHAGPGVSGPLLSWTGDAMLEAADEVSGPWLPIRGLTSPYLIQFEGAKKFFRLAAPSGDADCGDVAWSPSVWNIDVPSVRIQGRFLLNSHPFPSSFLQGANFFLRRASAGDEVYLGLSNNETFNRRVVPGIYDVIYEHKIGDEVPLNTVAVVIGGLEISSDQAFDIDVPAVGVSGAFLFNGAPAPASQLENGRIQTRDRQNGALTLLGETRDQTYAAMLIPGAYDFVYSTLTGSAIAPANRFTAFQRNVSILSNGLLNIDVPTIQLTGAFTVNGAPTPVTETEAGRISLLDPETGTKVLLGHTTFQQYQRRVIPGTYDVHYEGLTGGHTMPANSSARFLSSVALAASGVFNIDLPVVQISGAFRVNGAPTPNAATENALITLRQGEDNVYLGYTTPGTFQRLVIPATYQVHFENITGTSIMPANTNAILSTVQITNTSVFNINILVVEFGADVKFNGGDFPGPTDGELARLYLEASGGGGRIYLGNFPGPYDVSRLVVPGTYRLRYEYESGVQLPRNTYATLGSPLVVTQNVQTVINVGAAALSGSFSLNGAAFPAPGQNAAITLKSLTQGDSLYVGGTQAGTYSTVIVPGNYVAHYNWAQGDLVPRNQNARLICPR
ncbi:MAG TPA: hypothetical protein VK846_10695, partial [Candidatus Limnocylindria bacterium]|nr:hypothetical protein [Candidatus Limnocylindria bacterium]